MIPVYEEQLRVGKRDVSHGRVRIRSYVVETPVNEQVRLRSESVQVERKPVDRPIAAGDELFQDASSKLRNGRKRLWSLRTRGEGRAHPAQNDR